MQIAYTTTFDAEDVNNWSGTPYHMAKAFESNGQNLHYIGNLKRKLPWGFKSRQFIKKMCGQRESPRFNQFVAEEYSRQILKPLLDLNPEVIISPRVNPIAYLDLKAPIVLWTDALYASLIGFYPQFNNHSANTIKAGNTITEACLERCKLAIFSSHWAARSAIEIYAMPANKVQVVPFGANIQTPPSCSDIRQILQKRSRDTVKLLFIGKHWLRKGGDIVFKVAKTLHSLGQAVELHFVGCHPPSEIEIPPYIHCHGFISKRTAEGLEKITRLLSESHFLFVPSRAEAFGIVFCEANTYGLPAISTTVGGISSVIRDDINGKMFSLQATSAAYAEYIMGLMQNYSQYEEFALSSHNEFMQRLNWKVATATVTNLIQAI